MKKQAMSCLAAACCTIFLCGCSMMPFETVEETQKKSGSEGALSMSSTPVRPADLVGKDLEIKNTLSSSTGVLLATYKASLPQFKAEGDKSSSYKLINDYYETEFKAFTEDCDSFFQMVKKDLGTGWMQITNPVTVQSTDYSYELQDCSDKYVSVIRSFNFTDRTGQQITYYYGDVFSTETGWRLKLDDLFGKNTSKAKKTLEEQLKAWCKQNGIDENTVSKLDLNGLTEEFSLTSQDLVLCIEPFELSNNDKSGRIIKLPLSAFSQWMSEE